MSALQYSRTVLVVLGVMAAIAVVEATLPLFVRPTLPGRQRANLAMTLQTLAFAFVLTSVVSVAAVWLPFASPAFMAALGLPTFAQLIVGIVAIDFAFGYVAHWSMHASPVLWKYHRVHHSDAFVDVTTSYRTHPVESAWRHLWMFVTIWALGIPVAGVVAFRMLSAVNGLLEHANIRVAPALDAALSRAWVTPNMHKVHHSRDQAETDANFGNLFTLHDRVFGTFLPTQRALSVTYGLDDVDPAETRSLGALLAMPWRSASGRNDRAVRNDRSEPEVAT